MRRIVVLAVVVGALLAADPAAAQQPLTIYSSLPLVRGGGVGRVSLQTPLP